MTEREPSGAQVGTTAFVDGVPSDDTAETVYDYLDFMHGLSAYLNNFDGASTYPMEVLGWFPILRFCSPLESFFARSWRPSEIERVGA
jgi:hypothetical protein